MSVFGDFQQVWLQRFPQSELPAAWEEDVRANLSKHKQKVALLKEELEKEEFYVEYLERLLSDVENHKNKTKSHHPIKTNDQEVGTDDNQNGDVIIDSISTTTTTTTTANNVTNKNIEADYEPSAPPPAPATAAATVDSFVESITTQVTKCETEAQTDEIEEPQVRRSNSTATSTSPEVHDKSRRNTDPSNFVTVIEVNGLKDGTKAAKKMPPKPPPKKPSLHQLDRDQDSHGTIGTSSSHSSSRAQSRESLASSTEHLGDGSFSHGEDMLAEEDEPYYDSVAADTGDYRGSQEDMMASTLPMPAPRSHTSSLASVALEPESPGKSSNYVNIEYFIHKHADTRSSSDDEGNDVGPNLLRMDSVDAPETIIDEHEGSYASSSSLDSTTPASKRKFNQEGDVKVEAERMTMYRCILSNIIESETNYVEWLNILLQYMKAIKATVYTSQPVISEAEFKTIFYKIPELHLLHSNFLDNLKLQSQKWDSRIGDIFKNMASNLNMYGAFLNNYGRAVDTVRKCSSTNLQFGEITKDIKCKHLSGQSISLEDLLHKPVARVQKNALVLYDLLKYTSNAHPDHKTLSEALDMTQTFLDQFNMIQTKSMFPASDRAQRRLVKNSFIVELVDGHRKLRHLFLFNDVIACAKYKSSGRNEKYTFLLKWYIPVEDIHILEETSPNPHESTNANIVALKSQAFNVRDQLRLEERSAEEKKIRIGRGSEKHRKRLAELESQLVLVSPNLVFRIRNKNTQKTATFFLSSEFERSQWIEAIHTLQQTSQPPNPNATYSMFELQTWITACRTFLKTNMGSYLLRSGRDESLLVGDLYVTIKDLQGLEYTADLYVCIEVDFYGHFFRKAKSKMVCGSNAPRWNESFVIDLEGAENLRILVYRETGQHATLFGKHTQKLSRQWLGVEPVDKAVQINGCSLNMTLKFVPCEVTLRRVPTAKSGALFGEKIQQVCKRQKRDIPFIVTSCVREVERRGMNEVGVYRVSGSASDLSRLKKSFETNSYEAEQLLKEVDIHSVTGILKLYLRELPEALFTDMLYPQLVESFNQSNNNLMKRMDMLRETFEKLPIQNKQCIQFLLEHLIRVNKYEAVNKMSLHNLATVFGPTLLRPGGKQDSHKQRDLLVAGTADVMAQAGILYCYLQDPNLNRKH